MGPSLGDAVVNVTANTQPLEQGVKKIGAGGGLRKAILGSAAGNLIADGVGKILGGVVSVGKKVVDISVGKGFDRALNIDTARFKLQGLGHDAESVDAIMGNALASVEGTAFGLGEAATAAASAVAAGVKPGEDLTRVLSLTGDAAAIMGRSFGESGAIINKVLASNRVSMQEVNQLQDAGLPILQMLADQYGVTTDEMRKMVSEGKVGSEQFLSAIEDNIGGAAKEMGGSFAGMRANMMAAFGRLGEAVIGPLMPVFQEFMGTVTDLANELKPLAQELGAELAPVIKQVLAAITPLIPVIASSLIGAIKALLPALAPLVQSLFPTLASLIGTLAPLLSRLVPVIVTLVNAFAPLIPVVLSLVEKLLPPLMAAIEALLPPILAIVTPLSELLVPVLELVAMIATEILVPAIEATSGILTFLLENAIMPLVDGLVKFLVPILTTVIGWFGGVYTAINDLVTKGTGPLRTFIDSAVGWFRNMKDKVSNFMNAVWGVIKKVWSYTPLGLIVSNWDKIMAFFRGIPGKVKGFFENAVNWLKSAGKNIMSGLSNGVRERWTAVKDWLSGRVTAIKNVFKNAATMLVSAGKNVISGLWNGLKSAWTSVAKWFTDKLNWVKGLWPFSPAKHGPLSGSGSPFNMGKNFVNILADGLKASDSIDKAMGGIAEKMATTTMPAPAAMGGFGGIGSTGGHTVNNTTVNVKVEVKGSATVEDGRRVGQGIEEALRELGMTAVTR